MKLTKHLLIFFILSMAWCACDDEMENPGYSEIPYITFKSIEFIEGHNLDTIKITIDYQDGDADLGLAGNEIDYPYHRFDTIKNQHNEYIVGWHYYNDEQLRDSLSAEPCIDWTFTKDTIPFLAKANKFRHNLYADIFIKSQDEFEEYLHEKDNFCTSFNLRFPIIQSNKRVLGEGPFKITQKSKWEGTMEIKYPSGIYKTIFKKNEIKFKIQIVDRALNESNVVETDEFVLP